MATGLRWFDGFESVTTLANSYFTVGPYTTVSGSYLRSGSYGLRIENLGASTAKIGLARWGFTATDRAIVGAAFNLRTISNKAPLLQLVEGYNTAQHVWAAVHSDFTVGLYRGDGVLLATSTKLVPFQTWFYMELKAVVHNTAGSAEVRIGGTTYCSVTNVDTYNGGSSPPVINGFRILRGELGGYSASDQWIDDIYFVDASVGGATFLGDVRVMRLTIDNAGTSTMWSPSSGSNYQCVDEAYSATTTTDYVQSSTPADKDTYSLSNLGVPASSTVHAVQVITEAQRTDSGSRTIRSVIVTSGTTATGATTLPPYGGVTLLRDIWDTAPGGGAWSVSAVDGTEAGVEVVA